MLHITYHQLRKGMTGNKMDGMVSINTLPALNDFCMKMREDKENICSACYCKKSEFYPGIKKTFGENTYILSSELIDKSKLPYINHVICRFNAFGELVNKLHYKNLVAIARKNSHVVFTLWTKRPELTYGIKKPDNMILILSSLKKNEIAPLPKNFNKVFTVFNAGYLREHTDIQINCGAKHCLTCRKCYSLDNSEVYINESLK